MNTTKPLTTYCLLQTAVAGDLWGEFSLHRETHRQPFQVNHATAQLSAHWNPHLAPAASCKCPDRGSDHGCLEAAVSIVFRLQYSYMYVCIYVCVCVCIYIWVQAEDSGLQGYNAVSSEVSLMFWRIVNCLMLEHEGIIIFWNGAQWDLRPGHGLIYGTKLPSVWMFWDKQHTCQSGFMAAVQVQTWTWYSTVTYFNEHRSRHNTGVIPTPSRQSADCIVMQVSVQSQNVTVSTVSEL